jgi:hypothetical protein
MMRFRNALAIALSLGLAGCVLAPTRVERGDIDQGLALGAYHIVCKGLEMEKADVREYATTKFHMIEEPIAAECVCEHIYREDKWDEAVARGLKGAKRDDMVTCLADVLDDPRLDREAELVAALNLTGAPVVPERLFAYAKRAGDPKARAIAVRGLLGTTSPEVLDFLLDKLASDPSSEVRSAALHALQGQDDARVGQAIRAAYSDDQDPVVRLEALRIINDGRPDDRDELICGSIMDDPAPEVRIAALGMYKGTQRDVALDCLRERTFTEEPDPKVRAKLLEILKSSKSDEAKDMLCELVPVWLARHAEDEITYNAGTDQVTVDPGLQVMEAQNDRDWERSPECAKRAWSQRGKLHCYGQGYLTMWMITLGNKVARPGCLNSAAVQQQSAGAGGAGVLSFE